MVDAKHFVERETKRDEHKAAISIQRLDYDLDASLVCRAKTCLRGPGDLHQLGIHVIEDSVDGRTVAELDILQDRHLADIGLASLNLDPVES